jgi:hypothetical protein
LVVLADAFSYTMRKWRDRAPLTHRREPISSGCLTINNQCALLQTEDCRGIA